ncbi:MAG: V-type ATP synthase subunit K [Christensenellales bacterium]|jgi:V/A-type H+-transporting ATPase subunit K
MADFLGEYTGMVISTLGAVIAALLAGIGSARGMNFVAQAAAGFVSEEPDRFGQALVLQLLPGTQGVYGLLVAFLILINNGVIGGGQLISGAQGWIYFFGAMPAGFVGLFSAIYQGKAAVAGVNLLCKRPDEQGKAMMMPLMVETYAVFALLVSMLIILLGKAA